MSATKLHIIVLALLSPWEAKRGVPQGSLLERWTPTQNRHIIVKA